MIPSCNRILSCSITIIGNHGNINQTKLTFLLCISLSICCYSPFFNHYNIFLDRDAVIFKDVVGKNFLLPQFVKLICLVLSQVCWFRFWYFSLCKVLQPMGLLRGDGGGGSSTQRAGLMNKSQIHCLLIWIFTPAHFTVI